MVTLECVLSGSIFQSILEHEILCHIINFDLHEKCDLNLIKVWVVSGLSKGTVAFVGLRWTSLAFVGLHWTSLAFVGLHWLVGLRWLSSAFII